MTENPPFDGDDKEKAVADAWRAAIDRCRQPLRDFMPTPQDHEGFACSARPAVKVRVPREWLPLPRSVELVMLLVLEAHNLGRGEKLTWEFPFTFRNRPCSIALENFGLRLYLGLTEREDSSIVEKTVGHELIGKLFAATQCLEKGILLNIADEQVKAGRITIGNQVDQLRGMYEYFRNCAEEAYAGRGPLMRKYDKQVQDAQSSPQFSERMRADMMRVRLPVERQREGFYTMVAMISAYCSLLEHMLVLVLPATDLDPATESITDFIRLPILDKYKRVFDTNNPTVEKFRERLCNVRDKWRNPYTHGGFNSFNKKTGTILFHLPDHGALPMSMSNIRTHPMFHLAPERESSFDQVCALFDELDAWLRSSPVKHGVQWAESGLDVPFNPEFLTEFRAASGAGDAVFKRFLERTDHAVDQALNMDW